jgi:spore germination cell wall hydrolase CwlJ-like protein
MTTAKILLVYILQTFSLSGTISDVSRIDENEAYCLAKNIYFEARGEGIQGQKAVALVTMNRVNSERYPDTICGVVEQSAKLKYSDKVVCAFSWVCSDYNKVPVIKKNGTENERVIREFETAAKIAVQAMQGELRDITKGATHFFNPEKAQPKWAEDLQPTMTLGKHVFYK